MSRAYRWLIFWAAVAFIAGIATAMAWWLYEATESGGDPHVYMIQERGEQL